MAINRANVAVQIMEHLCECPAHGYSQPGRYGTTGYCGVATDAGSISVKRGDRDCSSAVCEAWELALAGTDWEGAVTRYNTTWSMKELFLNSGLFEWKPMSFDAEPGDVYLDIDEHTAMCVQNDGVADLLAEFSISETGDIDGEPGDQTGWESSVHGYYSGSWDGILHYNHRADGGENFPSGGDLSSGGGTEPPMPRYRVAIMENGKKTWLPWMRGMVDEGGSNDSFAGEPGSGIVDVEFDEATLGPQGWFEKNMCNGALIGLTVYYDTPDPGVTGWWYAKYRVHWLGDEPGWGKWEIDDEDGGAGNDCDQVDMIELTITSS